MTRSARGSPEPPTHDGTAEAAVLSAVLLSPKLLEVVAAIITPGDFFDARHRLIAHATWALFREGAVIDVTTVASRLRANGDLRAVGGTPYLADLTDATPAVAHVEAHAEIVREHSRKRRLVASLRTFVAEAMTSSGVNEIANRIGEAMSSIVQSDTKAAKPSVLEDRWIQLKKMPEILVEHPPSQTWLLEQWHQGRWRGVFPRGQTGLLSADGGAGKGFALADLVIAIARGGFWLETFRAVERGCVLLALCEDELDEVRRRLFRVANALRLSDEERREIAERIDLLHLRGVPVALTRQGSDRSVCETEFADQLRQKLEARNVDWSAIVLDPLSRWAAGGVEVDNESATRFVEVLEKVTAVRGHPSVLLAHHASKFSVRGGRSDSRGVSGLRNAVRWEVTLDVVRGSDGSRGAILRNGKNNLAAQFDDLVLIRRDESGVEGTLRIATDEEAEMFASGRRIGGAVSDDEIDVRICETIRRGEIRSVNKLVEQTKGTRSRILQRTAALEADGTLFRDEQGVFRVREDG